MSRTKYRMKINTQKRKRKKEKNKYKKRYTTAKFMEMKKRKEKANTLIENCGNVRQRSSKNANDGKLCCIFVLLNKE